MTNFEGRLNRRSFLTASAAAGISGLFSPSILRAADREMSVSIFGGNFESAFKDFIYPAFKEKTGISVTSVTQPSTEVWLVQMINAANSNVTPADVSILSGAPKSKGILQNIFLPLDMGKIPNSKLLASSFIEKDKDGAPVAVAGLAWYSTLCTNTEVYPEAPTSWKALWDPANKGNIAVVNTPSASFLLEMTAKTFFGNTDILDTREGIETVFGKMEQIVPNVRLWYADDGQFQALLQSGEIPMGQFFHDVTMIGMKEGYPIRSTFPEEGGILDFGSWVIPRTSPRSEEGHAFIDFICEPSTQALLSRKVNTAPVVDRKQTDLTAEEFAAVSSEIPPIMPKNDMYLTHGDWINERWSKMLAG